MKDRKNSPLGTKSNAPNRDSSKAASRNPGQGPKLPDPPTPVDQKTRAASDPSKTILTERPKLNDPRTIEEQKQPSPLAPGIKAA